MYMYKNKLCTITVISVMYIVINTMISKFWLISFRKGCIVFLLTCGIIFVLMMIMAPPTTIITTPKPYHTIPQVQQENLVCFLVRWMWCSTQ